MRRAAMLHDFNDYPPRTTLDADVCIVGAGAAGITLARAFLGARAEVVLLESGGVDYEAATQALYAGPNLGLPYYDLDDARLRFFGGTTAIWGGRCAPLDALDFEPRAWVPWSGWPITRADLEPWYERAHAAFELGRFDYDAPLAPASHDAAPPFDIETITPTWWRLDETRDRFCLARCQDLVAAPNVRIVLHASCTMVHANVASDAIEELEIASLAGPRGRVRARSYVLACGGIENARLLLASRDRETAGIGNRHDLVGRFFMEHPHARVGRIVMREPWRAWTWFRRTDSVDGVPVAQAWRPAPRLQRERHTLNAALTVKLQRDPAAGLALGKQLYRAAVHSVNPTRTSRRLWQAHRAWRRWSARYLRPHLERLRARWNTRQAYLVVRGEQAPNPASRVCLSNERDALGQLRAALDWRLQRQDKDSVATIVAALDGEFRRLGRGQIEAATWLTQGGEAWPNDPTVSSHAIGGYHHMGTTRMASTAQAGVVDADCGVHGYANLFIAGSSVFPTSGWANPTLTIVALAMRLGAHLRSSLAERR